MFLDDGRTLAISRFTGSTDGGHLLLDLTDPAGSRFIPRRKDQFTTEYNRYATGSPLRIHMCRQKSDLPAPLKWVLAKTGLSAPGTPVLHNTAEVRDPLTDELVASYHFTGLSAASLTADRGTVLIRFVHEERARVDRVEFWDLPPMSRWWKRLAVAGWTAAFLLGLRRARRRGS